jgi:Ca2+-dependent lipid-binding protein
LLIVILANLCGLPRSNPTWSEIKFILVNNLNESLVLSIFDWNEHRKNTPLGAVSFELAPLLQDATHEGIDQPILKDGKERGQLKFDIAYYPVLKPEHVNGEDVVPESSGFQDIISCSSPLTRKIPP